MANKNERIAWALMAHNTKYDSLINCIYCILLANKGVQLALLAEVQQSWHFHLKFGIGAAATEAGVKCTQKKIHLMIYWISIDINFNSRLPVYDGKEENIESHVCGALMDIGVTDESEENAKSLVLQMISTVTDWDISNYSVNFERIGIIEAKDIESEIFRDEDVKDSLIQDPLKKGVWYKAGFGLYSDE